MWRRAEHINVLEVRMAGRALARAARKHRNCRQVLLVDSLVACGVINRGRSASVALNREWSRYLGVCLGCRVRPALHYIPS
eukprot:5739606-Lingulodinium_polyedra.AAC.1